MLFTSLLFGQCCEGQASTLLVWTEVKHFAFGCASLRARRWDLGEPDQIVVFLRIAALGVCCFVLLKPILGNRSVRSQGFIVSEPRETHPRSEIADVPTSPCPPIDKLGCPDPHPPP